jgi:hypothetical protein
MIFYINPYHQVLNKNIVVTHILGHALVDDWEIVLSEICRES